MSSPKTEIILFDPFETLGSEIAVDGERFTRFTAYPSARELLERVGRQARVGVLALDPEVPLRRLRIMLVAERLSPPIDLDLVRVAQKGERRPFSTLLAESEQTAESALFVSLDAGRRVLALAEGLRVAPHPSLVPDLLAGESLRYARIAARDGTSDPEFASILRDLSVVPLLRTRSPDRALYAIATRSQLHTLASLEAVATEELGGPDAVSGTSLVLLRVTAEDTHADPVLRDFVASLAQRGYPLVRETPEGWLIAMPGDLSLDEIHPPPGIGSRHGHTALLLPDLASRKLPAPRVDPTLAPLGTEEREEFQELDATALQRYPAPRARSPRTAKGTVPCR